MKKPNYFSYSIAGCLIFWFTLLIAQTFKFYNPEKISNFAAQCEFIIHLFTITISTIVYKRLSTENRAIWFWLLSANINLFFTDLFFYITVYLSQKYILSTSFFTVIFGYIPYLFALFSFIIFLSKILIRGVAGRIVFLKLFPILLVLNSTIIFLFLSSINYKLHFLSWQTLSHILSLTLEFVIFNLILLCLIYSENIAFSTILAGIIIIIAGDSFINYSFLSQTSNLLPSGELLWFLGLMIILFGTLATNKKIHCVKYWHIKAKKIKNKLALWSFCISIFSFLGFYIIAYCSSMINKGLCLTLPLFIMGYSVTVVILSIFMGACFEAPFKKLATNIETLMLNEKSKIDDQFFTEEFISLQKFIMNVFELRREKDQVKKRLGEICAQVAHDIRSPVAALLVLSLKCTSILEIERTILRDATQTIQDIANNILNQYQTHETEEPIAGYKSREILLSALIQEVISEKRLQYVNKHIKFKFLFQPNTHFAFIKGDQTQFKCMLSNLINNAIDACEEKEAKIIFTLTTTNEKLILSIIDNGKGMSQKLIDRIRKAETVTSNKKSGHGIGLQQVHKTLEIHQGRIDINSNLGIGTQVKLTFPRSEAPNWIVDKIELNSNFKIIILDDHTSIHTAWDHRLKEAIQDINLEVLHFKEGQEVIDLVMQLSESEKNQILLLTDYELLRQSRNGLDILEILGVKHAILVTSHYTNPEILKRATLVGAKILPKSLVAEIAIQLK